MGLRATFVQISRSPTARPYIWVGANPDTNAVRAENRLRAGVGRRSWEC